jgi:exonuclease III
MAVPVNTYWVLELKIAHINACSLLPKIDLIELEMSNNDIILVSETRLSQDIHNEDIQLRGFQNPIRVDRNRHGGGVAIFAKPNIYICEKPEFHTSEIEILWLEVIINNLKAMVGVIYRPPHSGVSYWRKFEGNTCWLPHNIL